MAPQHNQQNFQNRDTRVTQTPLAAQQTTSAQPNVQAQASTSAPAVTPPVEPIGDGKVQEAALTTQQTAHDQGPKIILEMESLDVVVDSSFEGLIEIVVGDLIQGTTSPLQAKTDIINWIGKNPSYTLDEAYAVMARLKGAVDTVAQELPRMFLR